MPEQVISFYFIFLNACQHVEATSLSTFSLNFSAAMKKNTQPETLRNISIGDRFRLNSLTQVQRLGNNTSATASCYGKMCMVDEWLLEVVNRQTASNHGDLLPNSWGIYTVGKTQPLAANAWQPICRIAWVGL